MTIKNIPESDTYLTTKNNRPVREAIDVAFTNKTIKERGNQVRYSFNGTTNELRFEEESVGRATVFMDRNIVDLSIEGRLDWVTLYTDPVGYRTFGFYAKDPSRLGFVCFINYTLSGYEFETRRPEFSKFSSEKIRFQYDGEGWNIYDEDTFLGKVTPEDFSLTSTETSEMIPMIGFRIDSSTTLPYNIMVKGYRKSTDARLNVSGNVERADYTKTNWVAYDTLVSADSLNNIENELEYVSNTIKTLDVELNAHKHTISDVTNLQTQLDSKASNEKVNAHLNDLAKHNQFMDGDKKKQITFGVNSDLGCLTINISEVIE